MDDLLKYILLVEDDDADAELFISSLKEYNLANELVRVNNGEEAIDFLLFRNGFESRRHNNPCVVLLDLKMPKLNGLETLRFIREHEKLRYLPVVILTSSKEEQDMVRGYELGVNAYVVKPVDFTQFAEAVKSLGIFWAAINEPPPGE